METFKRIFRFYYYCQEEIGEIVWRSIYLTDFEDNHLKLYYEIRQTDTYI